MSRFKWLVGSIFFYTFLIFAGIATSSSSENDLLEPIPMPLQQSFADTTGFSLPTPHRDETVRKYLAPTMRIRVGNSSGSGTICYYDRSKNIAYVISCAHLFDSRTKAATLEFFYKNDQKLSTPARYQAEVIAVKIGGYDDDISFIKFTPDWQPTYFPIANENYTYETNKTFYSCGCDHAEEVACYFIKITEVTKAFITTKENSPRPGRSGGGLLTDDGWYVGICVRTSDASGAGYGYFVQLKSIHAFARVNNLEWLTNIGKYNDLLRRIPIVDRMGFQHEYPLDYIPIPN